MSCFVNEGLSTNILGAKGGKKGEVGSASAFRSPPELLFSVQHILCPAVPNITYAGDN